MVNQNDPRVLRTKHLIMEAFRDLLKKKGFDAITIKDISQGATINRATFYAHYEDKYALLDDITAMTFKNMIPKEIAQAQEFTEDVCRQFIKLTYDHITAFYGTCKFNTKSIGAQVDSIVKRILHETIESVLKKSESSYNTNINAAMISAVIYSASYYWYEANKSNDIDQLADTVIPFIINGLQKKN